MEIYLIYEEDREKNYLFAAQTRSEAEKIQNYLNNEKVNKRGNCYTSIMTKIESIPFGTLDDYVNKERTLNDIIFERTRELESLKEKLKKISK